ncbi:MAG: hypothetical protein J6S17_02890, partial [Aeriscardovia sp.]|nr:hypothetical protein [Aeriscardovia sp.]
QILEKAREDAKNEIEAQRQAAKGEIDNLKSQINQLHATETALTSRVEEIRTMFSKTFGNFSPMPAPAPEEEGEKDAEAPSPKEGAKEKGEEGKPEEKGSHEEAKAAPEDKKGTPQQGKPAPGNEPKQK